MDKIKEIREVSKRYDKKVRELMSEADHKIDVLGVRTSNAVAEFNKKLAEVEHFFVLEVQYILREEES